VVHQRKQFHRMHLIIDGMEQLLFESYKNKGLKWTREEPMWATWSLEKFGMVVSYLFG
jgi:hypothetical protein